MVARRRRALFVVPSVFAGLSASVHLVVAHYQPGLSDSARGFIFGVPLGLALVSLAMGLKLHKEDCA